MCCQPRWVDANVCMCVGVLCVQHMRARRRRARGGRARLSWRARRRPSRPSCPRPAAPTAPPPSLGSRGHPPRRAFLPSALPGFPPGPARVRASVRGLRTNGMRTRTTRASVPARRLRVRVARGAQRFCFSWRQLRSGGASQAEATVRNCTKRTVVWWWGARTRWQK